MARSLVHELQRSSQLSGDVAAAAIQIMNMKASRPSWIQISQGRHLNAFEGPVASRKYIRAMNASTPYRRGQNPKKNRKITDAPTQTIFHATLWGTWQSPPSPLLMAAATLAATAITMRVRRIWTKRIYHIQGNPRGADLSVEFANMAMTNDF